MMETPRASPSDTTSREPSGVRATSRGLRPTGTVNTASAGFGVDDGDTVRDELATYSRVLVRR